MIQIPDRSRASSRSAGVQFPGRLYVPNASQKVVPSVDIIPPPTRSRPPSPYMTYLENRLRPNEHGFPNEEHHRHFSVSSCATHYSQRTQSTFQVLPTRTRSATNPTCKGRSSFERCSGRSSTSINFLKRAIRRGSTGTSLGNEIHQCDGDAYEELGSQTTDPNAGFQYAATPSVGDLLNTEEPPEDRLRLPVLVPPLSIRSTPSPRPAKTKKSVNRSCINGIKFIAELANRLREFIQASRKASCPLTISISLKSREPQNDTIEQKQPSVEGQKPKYMHQKPAVDESKNPELEEYPWGYGEQILRIKNSTRGTCIFMLVPVLGSPQEFVEKPLSFSFLKTQLFAHSKSIPRALDEWNKHYQNPPPHWVVNFVPKAYLRRGWHLAEEVAKYFKTYGLDAGVNAGGMHRGPWKVEYEAIGYKACVVDEGGRIYGNEHGLKVQWDRERHPSRVWERKEGWEGCGNLQVGIAL